MYSPLKANPCEISAMSPRLTSRHSTPDVCLALFCKTASSLSAKFSACPLSMRRAAQCQRLFDFETSQSLLGQVVNVSVGSHVLVPPCVQAYFHQAELPRRKVVVAFFICHLQLPEGRAGDQIIVGSGRLPSLRSSVSLQWPDHLKPQLIQVCLDLGVEPAGLDLLLAPLGG